MAESSTYATAAAAASSSSSWTTENESKETKAKFEDHYSVAVGSYSAFRPTYPDSLFDYLASLAPGRGLCIDCGTGNGQAAVSLSRHFDRLIAFDPAEAMIEKAIKTASNVQYIVSRSEDFGSHPAVAPHAGQVDLITAFTAAHWFGFDAFYRQAFTMLKPGDILTTYTRVTLRGYWPAGIVYTASKYSILPFPAILEGEFLRSNTAVPPFAIERQVTLEQTVGLMHSWSGTQRRLAARGPAAFDAAVAALKRCWPAGGNGTERFVIPLFSRIGRKPMAGVDVNAPLELRPPLAELPVEPLAD